MVQREKLEENKILQERILVILREGKYRKVEELIDAVRSTDRSLTFENAKVAIESLEDDGKISLNDPAIHGTFASYLVDFYSNIPFWLGLAGIAVSLVMLFVFPTLGPLTIIRIIAGGASVLFLPGYGLLGLLFARKELPLLERIGISFILSLAIIIVLWLALNKSLLGSDDSTTAISASAASILLLLGSAYRRFLVRKEDTKILK